MNKALRAGMTGGVMGTIALTASAAPASAADNEAAAETTVEIPALSADLADSSAQAAHAIESSADEYELRQAQDTASSDAMHQAMEKAKKHKEKVKAEAEAARKAEAARQAKAEAAKEQSDRASRSDERTSLASASSESGNTGALIDFLKGQVGKAYVLGASGPSSYDCSGLTQTAFQKLGVDLPRTSQDQSTTGTSVSVDSVQPGDILYWGGAGSAHHVAVYVGDGKFIGAQNSSTGVVERDMSYDQPDGAVRVL